MERVVNTAIIGAGPAGLACAMRLQKAKISHLLLEKKSFPRDKTCGGLSPKKHSVSLPTPLGFPKRSSLPSFAMRATRSAFIGGWIF